MSSVHDLPHAASTPAPNGAPRVPTESRPASAPPSVAKSARRAPSSVSSGSAQTFVESAESHDAPPRPQVATAAALQRPTPMNQGAARPQAQTLPAKLPSRAPTFLAKAHAANAEDAPSEVGSARTSSTVSTTPSLRAANASLAEKADAYLDAAQTLRNASAGARKVMPMVMQSAGLGLALAAAIHNPLLLFLAPVIAVSGALLAAPAGWAMAKFMQWRMLRRPDVRLALRTLDELKAFPDQLDNVRELVAEQLGGGPAAITKLERGESFARGQNIFKDGLRRCLPFNFWRNRFDEAMQTTGMTMPGYVPLAAKGSVDESLDAEREVAFDYEDELKAEVKSEHSAPLTEANLRKYAGA